LRQSDRSSPQLNIAVSDLVAQFHSAQAFNGDLSTWNVSSVQDASRMFNEAFVFNHSLCSWRDKLPVDAVVTDMFNLSACAYSNEPLLTAATSANVLEPWSGPFCSVCNDSDK
jgi:Mycoplasma protein of unknown function, DUF285